MHKPRKIFSLIFVVLAVYLNCRDILSSDTQESKASTVFIHGTIPSMLKPLIRKFMYPVGIKSLAECQKYMAHNIGRTLNEACNIRFPLDSFYIFGWSGELCFKARLKEARNLYSILKSFEGPINLICHSHGCNVALNLARVAQEHNDEEFKIENLILLACPVQHATSNYILSGCFRRIYSLYSDADLIQVADPQGIYKTKYSKSSSVDKIPLFSGRIFKPCDNLIQAQVKFGKKGLAHLDFRSDRFLKNLPSLINSLEKQAKLKNSGDNHFCVSINENKSKQSVSFDITNNANIFSK